MDSIQENQDLSHVPPAAAIRLTEKMAEVVKTAHGLVWAMLTDSITTHGLPLNQSDIVVVQTNQELSRDALAYIATTVKKPLLVISSGLYLSALSDDDLKDIGLARIKDSAPDIAIHKDVKLK
jgi:uncharacterized protein YjiS (DUF1127 family)